MVLPKPFVQYMGDHAVPYDPGGGYVFCALLKEHALEAIELLRGSEVIVVGGDVLSMRGGKLLFDPCGWSFTGRQEEPLAARVERSIDEARGYMRKIPSQAGDEAYFVLVLSEAGLRPIGYDCRTLLEGK